MGRVMVIGELARLLVVFLSAPLLVGAGMRRGGAGQSASPKPALSPASPQGPLAKEAIGILQQSCVSCHSGANPTGNLRLTSRKDLLKGGTSGPAVSLSRRTT